MDCSVELSTRRRTSKGSTGSDARVGFLKSSAVEEGDEAVEARAFALRMPSDAGPRNPGLGPCVREGHSGILQDGAIVSSSRVLLEFSTAQNVRRTFSTARMGVGLAVLIASGAAYFNMPATGFVKGVKVGSLRTRAECENACKKAIHQFDQEIHPSSTEPGDYEGWCGQVGNVKWAEPGTGKLVGTCEIKVPVRAWKALVSIAVFVVSMFLVIQGVSGEVCLLGGAAFLALLKILPPGQVYSGLTSSSMLSLAILFPIADAVSETGILEKTMGRVLGAPSSLNVALPRMMFPVAMLSSVLSNTATVAMMIPVLNTWSRRLGVHPGKLMLPLSFASQLGGVLTLIGTPACMAARDVTVHQYRGGEGMKFFDLSIPGLLLMFSGTVVMLLLAKTPLLSSSADTGDSEADDETADANCEVYCIRFTVRSGLAGKSIEETGVERLKGVSRVTCATGVGSGLQAGDQLDVFCTEVGLIAVRAQDGLELNKQRELEMLGSHRRHRFLYEVAVDAHSEFVTTNLLSDPSRLLTEYGAVFVAGPKVPLSEADMDPQVGPGSLLLFEANSTWIAEKARDAWCRAASMVMKIPDSSPQRVGGPVDAIRSRAVCVGMAVLILAAAFAGELGPAYKVDLHIGGSLLLIFYLLIRAISVERMFHVIDTHVLFIIVGAGAMGEALEVTGVIEVAADFLMTLVPEKPYAIMFMVYFCAMVMCFVIHGSATVTILGPMILNLAENSKTTAEPVSVEALTWVLAFAAGSCFSSPFGTTPNMMILGPGKYTFGDFVKYGFIVQLIHMVLTVGVVLLTEPWVFGKPSGPAAQ